MDIPQVTKTSDAPTGDMGQQYLATGKQVAMRRWEQEVGDYSDAVRRQYEIVGYVLQGELEIDLDGETMTIAPGTSWLIPEGARHRYRILKPLVAIEATSPPARFNDRDQPTKE